MRLPPPAVRRVVGPIVLAVAWLLCLVTLPALALAAAVASFFLPGRLRALRLLGFALAALTLELLTLAAAGALWLASGFGARLRSERFQRAHYGLLRRLLRVLVRVAQRLFALRIETDQVSWTPLDDGVPGSNNAMIVLSRHAGPGDSLLLLDTLMNRDHRRRPRTVLLHTLALDPVVDVLFHRLPSRFVDPHPAAGDPVQAGVAELASKLGDDDALLIFPEGGNYTPARRRRAIDKLRSRGHETYAERAEQMLHVLAPRPGGVLAAIEAAPDADLVLVAHTGLEHITGLRSAWHVLHEHKQLQLRWWFHAASTLPTGRDDRIAWLYERWTEIDDWIAEQEGLQKS
ncbi:MAG: 1-acyl-sn-glycerol-3-phosphate acyltransferase [Actinomycetota bacterium]|nr:1-acyl-sn-glycerol-3-phosphate acyltransferase [Actinomycetota bacterium]